MITTGCGGAVTPTPSQHPEDPAASTLPLTDDDLAVCDGTIRMDQGATRMRQVRLSQAAVDRLQRGLDLVTEGQALVLQYASDRMVARVRTLGFAVTNATIAIEDLRTTERVDASVTNVKRRTVALRRSIDSFRSWLGCPPPAPTTTAPPDTGSPEPSDPASSAPPA
jgi:hypothetical protein